MKSVMQHQFSQVPRADIPRSVFNRTHGYKTTFDSGYLIPFYVDEALPGDTFNLQATLFARLATPLFPIMDNMYMDVFYFAVPLRLIWDNFQKFMGEQLNPGDSTDYNCPQVTTPSGGYLVGSLFDYFGIPTEVDGMPNINAFWSRAYNLIYNTHFRDENLINSLVVDTDDGPDTDTDYVVKRRTKRHDYFTSCLPWPQKGDAVDLPLGTEAPILGIATNASQTAGASASNMRETYATGSTTFDGTFNASTSNLVFLEEDPNNPDFPWVRADLANATATSINTLREAFQLQKLLERDARGGTRYTEIIRSHFGVVSPDARLQRPEFLGGSSTPIIINPVQQTAEGTTTPVGKLTAFGYAADKSHGFTKSFTEHCVIIGLVNVRADLTYQQGIPRMFTRQTRFDFYWPALANLGEQAVYNKEIYAMDDATDTDSDGTSDNDEVFGYQERWAEYRYFPSKITGQFRSTYATSLDAWHLSQEFGSLPTLSETFIEENPPVNRVVADSDDPEFIFDSYLQLKCVRPMPVYSVPGLIDHF